MKTVAVGELKAQFSEILDKVQLGESFGILYGKKKRPVAMIVPFTEEKPKKPRKLGLLEGMVNITFARDFKMTEEELLELK